MLDHDRDAAPPQDEPARLSAAVRGMRIIIVALVAGVATFAAIAAFMVHGGGGPVAPNNGLMTVVLLGMAAPVLLAQFAMPIVQQNAVRANLLKQPIVPPERLLMAFQTRLIITCALCEGAAIMAVMAYLMEGHVAALPFIGLSILLMLARFPSVDGVAGWMERERDWLQEHRAVRG